MVGVLVLGEQGGWPFSGEIDVMEHLGSERGIVYGALYGSGYSGARGLTRRNQIDGDPVCFHVYAVQWTPDSVTWLVNGDHAVTITPADLPSGTRRVFDQPQHLILNLAIGGRWPGDTTPATAFPAHLVVDHVRFYERA